MRNERSMKWWWLLVAVLLMSSTVQAEQEELEIVRFIARGIADDTAEHMGLSKEDWPMPTGTLYGIQATEPLEDVFFNIKFTIHPKTTLEHIRKGQCGVMWAGQSERQAKQVFPVRKGNNLNFWFPYLDQGTKVVLFIEWQEPTIAITTTSTRVRSEQGEAERLWKYPRGGFTKWVDHPLAARTVDLNEICQQFVDVPTSKDEVHFIP